MKMLPRLSRAMLSGRFGGDVVRTRVSPSLAWAAGDKATARTPANSAATRKRRLTLMSDPLSRQFNPRPAAGQFRSLVKGCRNPLLARGPLHRVPVLLGRDQHVPHDT